MSPIKNYFFALLFVAFFAPSLAAANDEEKSVEELAKDAQMIMSGCINPDRPEIVSFLAAKMGKAVNSGDARAAERFMEITMEGQPVPADAERPQTCKRILTRLMEMMDKEGFKTEFIREELQNYN